MCHLGGRECDFDTQSAQRRLLERDVSAKRKATDDRVLDAEMPQQRRHVLHGELLAVALLVGRAVRCVAAVSIKEASTVSPQVIAGPGVTVSNISVSSATTMTAQIRVAPDAATGPRSITVTVPGEIEATLPNGFRVQ